MLGSSCGESSQSEASKGRAPCRDLQKDPDRHPSPRVTASCWRCGRGGQRSRRQGLALGCRSESAGGRASESALVGPGWDTGPQTTGTRVCKAVTSVLLASDPQESLRSVLDVHTLRVVSRLSNKNPTHAPKCLVNGIPEALGQEVSAPCGPGQGQPQVLPQPPRHLPEKM